MFLSVLSEAEAAAGVIKLVLLQAAHVMTHTTLSTYVTVQLQTEQCVDITNIIRNVIISFRLRSMPCFCWFVYI